LMVHCRPVVEVSRSRPMVGRATVSPLKSMVMRRVVKAIAITTHHLRLRSVTGCILNLPGFRLADPTSAAFGSLMLLWQDTAQAVVGAPPIDYCR